MNIDQLNKQPPTLEDPVLVTGASGFLGRHIARLLARNSIRVVGIGHGSWPQQQWQAWGLSHWHEADVTVSTLEALEQHTGKPSAILHCAGSGSVAFSVQNPLGDFDRTVVSTAHVLEYVRLHAPDCKVVYPSSASIYGTADVLPIREDARPAPISPYGTHKLMAEQMVKSHAMQFHTQAAIVRLFSVYGGDLRKQLLWDACCKLAAGDHVFMGTGEEVRDWLQVEDAAELMLAAARHAAPACPIVNGGTGNGVTVREVLTHLGHCMGPDEAAPVFSGAHRTGDPSRYIADIQAATAWGWSPQCPWKQGIEDYARWWKVSAL